VHVEGAHPADVRFLFEEQQKRIGPALMVSFAYHATLIVGILLAFRYGADSTTSAVLPEQPNSNIIWLEPTGSRRGEAVGESDEGATAAGGVTRQDKITVPVIKPPKLRRPRSRRRRRLRSRS
jgi:hypothetical protein